MFRTLLFVLGACAPVKPLWVWGPNVLPFVVIVDKQLESDYLPAIDGAITWWNEQTGRTLFQRRGELWGDTGLVVFIRYTGADKILGMAERTGPTNAVIYLRDYEDVPQASRVVRHELGHVLGLQHEKFSESLMYPAILDRDYKISEQSWCVLKDLYHVGPPAPRLEK